MEAKLSMTMQEFLSLTMEELNALNRTSSFQCDLELTNKERVEVLELALEMIKSKKEKFICTSISTAYRELFITGRRYGGIFKSLIYLYVTEKFPELLCFKPKNARVGDVWWSENWIGRRKRIRVIKQLIKIYKS
jgi:hypothetical protein